MFNPIIYKVLYTSQVLHRNFWTINRFFCHPWFWRNLPKKTSGFHRIPIKTPRFPRKMFLNVLAAARRSDHCSISAWWLDSSAETLKDSVAVFFPHVTIRSKTGFYWMHCFFYEWNSLAILHFWLSKTIWIEYLEATNMVTKGHVSLL